MENSILRTVRKMVVGSESEECFDLDLMIHINSVFSILHHLGVGPENPVKISGEDDEWSLFTEDDETIEMVKTYTYFKVRLMFDPPANSFLVDSLEKQCTEIEWRLKVNCDEYYPDSFESTDSEDTD